MRLHPRKSATTALEGVRTTVAPKSTVTMAQMIGEACKGSVKEGRLSQCPLDHSPDRRVAMERAPCRRTLFVTVVRWTTRTT